MTDARPTGFLATLTPEQRAAALARTDDDQHGAFPDIAADGLATMVERVATAISAARRDTGGDIEAEAIAAIQAMREPTQAQFDRLSATGRLWRDLNSREVYQAMLDGALE